MLTQFVQVTPEIRACIAYAWRMIDRVCDRDDRTDKVSVLCWDLC